MRRALALALAAALLSPPASAEPRHWTTALDVQWSGPGSRSGMLWAEVPGATLYRRAGYVAVYWDDGTQCSASGSTRDSVGVSCGTRRGAYALAADASSAAVQWESYGESPAPVGEK